MDEEISNAILQIEIYNKEIKQSKERIRRLIDHTIHTIAESKRERASLQTKFKEINLENEDFKSLISRR